jgi:dinuclear metal center YbgI/SA1388 family protein
VITVGELVAHLDVMVPFAWAAEWDRVGLLAGGAETMVRSVLVAVDPSRAAIARAQELGANVLLTHHPAFLDPLDTVVAGTGPAGLVFEALRTGVALVNCHTNMDRAPAGADALPTLLGLETLSPLEPEGEDVARPRAGRICTTGGTTLSDLSVLVGERLSVRPRVWGEAGRRLERVAVAPGSGRSFVAAALAAGCDALVTGELRYHEAHGALEAGMSVIEAGHDATEWPLTSALAAIAATAPGLDTTAVVLDEVAYPWWIA